MKKILLLVLLLAYFSNAEPQITFNNANIFSFENSQATSIVETESGYFASGVYVDIIDSFYVHGSYFAKMDYNGNVQSVYTFVDSTG